MDTPLDRAAASRYKIRPNEIATFKMSFDLSLTNVNPQYNLYDLQFKMKKGETINGPFEDFGDICTRQVEIRPRFANP